MQTSHFNLTTKEHHTAYFVVFQEVDEISRVREECQVYRTFRHFGGGPFLSRQSHWEADARVFCPFAESDHFGPLNISFFGVSTGCFGYFKQSDTENIFGSICAEKCSFGE
jgi:hypothetical protein